MSVHKSGSWWFGFSHKVRHFRKASSITACAEESVVIPARLAWVWTVSARRRGGRSRRLAIAWAMLALPWVACRAQPIQESLSRFNSCWVNTLLAACSVCISGCSCGRGCAYSCRGVLSIVSRIAWYTFCAISSASWLGSWSLMESVVEHKMAPVPCNSGWFLNRGLELLPLVGCFGGG